MSAILAVPYLVALVLILVVIWRNRYPMLCAWCAGEGIHTVTGRTSVKGSTGICKKHAKEWRREAGI